MYKTTVEFKYFPFSKALRNGTWKTENYSKTLENGKDYYSQNTWWLSYSLSSKIYFLRAESCRYQT